MCTEVGGGHHLSLVQTAGLQVTAAGQLSHLPFFLPEHPHPPAPPLPPSVGIHSSKAAPTVVLPGLPWESEPDLPGAPWHAAQISTGALLTVYCDYLTIFLLYQTMKSFLEIFFIFFYFELFKS